MPQMAADGRRAFMARKMRDGEGKVKPWAPSALLTGLQRL